MNDDLISRQAAIDELNKMKIYRPLDSDRYVISDCLNKIVNLPTAQPEAEWIPVSERLPEKDNLVLATVWDAVVIAWRNIYGGWESAEDMYEKGDVTAWMPLPEPYQEGGE